MSNLWGMESSRFATAINCIDGRVQMPVNEWVRKNLGADYVDTITEPGVDKAITESIRQKVMISINAHHSSAIAIAGHHDCAGNPVSREVHLGNIRKCVQTVKSWKLPVRVVGLWVNDKWQVEVVE